MVEISVYDSSNITYSACYDYSATFFDAFNNDLFFRLLHPEFFGPNPTTPEPKLSNFLGALNRTWARKSKLQIMKGTDVLFLMRDGSSPVATCLCTLPVYKQKPVSWLQWLKIKVYEYYTVVADYLDGNPGNVLGTPEHRKFFGTMYGGTGAKEGPEYLAKLAELTESQLKEARYPYPQTLYVNILAVSAGAQGKGYGPQLLKTALDRYRDIEGPTFVSANGKETKAPAKASLFPTDGKETFYNRYGFKTVSSVTVPLEGYGDYKHVFMQTPLASV